jgi:hypothetical protein
MAQSCKIPPEYTIHDFIRIAVNENRMYDAIQIYNTMNSMEQSILYTWYPEIYNSLLTNK